MPERDWIEKYLRPIATSPDAMGLRNDVAILSPGDRARCSIATMDTLVEEIHFLATDPPATLAKKILRVNVSDILCKGARPSQALLSIAVPPWFGEQHFASFCESLGCDLRHWNADLIGGDLVQTDGPLVLSMTLIGVCCGDGPVTRSGAQDGDAVLVTGRIGAGRLGLAEAHSGNPGTFAGHYRVPEIPALGIADIVSRFASASIDISDGLIAEASHISTSSHISVRMNLEAVPWAHPCDTVEEMLRLATGGDDYQTLFTVSPALVDDVHEASEAAGISISRIGTVVQGDNARLTYMGRDIELPDFTGFNHNI